MDKLPAHAPVVTIIRTLADAYNLPASLVAAGAFADACSHARDMQNNPDSNPSPFSAVFRMHKMLSHILHRDGPIGPKKRTQPEINIDLYKIAAYSCRTVLKAASERQSGTSCTVKEAAMDMVRMAQEAFIQVVREDRDYGLFSAMPHLTLELSSGKPVTDTNLVRSVNAIVEAQETALNRQLRPTGMTP